MTVSQINGKSNTLSVNQMPSMANYDKLRHDFKKLAYDLKNSNDRMENKFTIILVKF